MTNITPVLAEDIIQKNMFEYGAYIIINRALPDIRDGLKPVQRRIYYTLLKEKATSFTKSANIEGAVMKIHPHGGSYGVIVNLTQKDKHSLPLIIGKGGFGQHTSKLLAPSAARYTEVKMSPLLKETLDELKNKTVNMIPTYDGSNLEPEVLPVTFPWVLTYAQSGVAYTMASDIPSFNINEVCESIKKYLQEGTKTLLIPDFATGGNIVYDKDSLTLINTTGKGAIKIRGTVSIDKKLNEIYITEIPYTTTREAIIDKVVKLSKTKFKEVSEIKDLTGLKGLKIKVKLKRGSDIDLAVAKLFEYTPLESSHSSNMNVISEGLPKVMGVWPIINEWLKWRRSVIVRKAHNEIEKLAKELRLAKALQNILLDIDEAIRIIRFSKDEDIEKELMAKFNIDFEAAEQVANMKLRRLNKDYILKVKDTIFGLEADIQDREAIIANEELQNDIIIKDMEYINNNYKVERRSKIVKQSNELKMKIKKVKEEEKKIEDYPVKILLTKDGYIKKVGLTADINNQYLKPGDSFVKSFATRNTAEVLVFDSTKACHKIKVHELAENTPKQLGTYIPTLTECKDIVGYSLIDETVKYVLIGYDNNKIVKVDINSFKLNRKKLLNSLNKSANAVSILTLQKDVDIIFKTDKAKFKINTSSLAISERWQAGIYGPRKGVLQGLYFPNK